MPILDKLHTRSNGQCELCGSTNELAPWLVPPGNKDNADGHILACASCREQLDDPDKVNPNHWRCLNDSMWSTVPAVQVVAWRMLNQLRGEGWPQDLLDMLFLEDETRQWAKALEPDEDAVVHLDSNGAVLEAGDTVTLIQDLNVKGANFTAKRGTAVRRISLVADNPEHIEGRVNGQQIVILTKFVKKSNK
jgi:protein PhnA